MRLLWSPQSVEDRKQIFAFIFEHNTDAAEAMDALFEAQAQRLLTYPEIGKIGRVPCTRELVIHKHYVLVYTCDDNTVGILTLLHTARQYPQ